MSRERTTPRARASRWVHCRLCDKAVTLNNFTTHRRAKHPEHEGTPRAELFDETEQPDGGGPSKAVAKVRHVSTVPPPVSSLPPLAADDIVTTVVEQLSDSSGLMPVAHLAAIFAWRDATSAFLRAVSR